MKTLVLSLLVLGLSLAESCTPGVSSSSPMLQLEKSDPLLVFSAGQLLYNNQPYSGYVLEYDLAKRLIAKDVYRQGKQEGISQRWYTNGRLAENRFYSDNRKSGRHEGWWLDGTKRFEYSFENDIPVGHHQTWYENGRPYTSFHFNSRGHEEGLQTMWYETGQIKANFNIHNGRRFGLLGAKGCAGK